MVLNTLIRHIRKQTLVSASLFMLKTEFLNVFILKGGLFSLNLSAVYMHRRQKCKEKAVLRNALEGFGQGLKVDFVLPSSFLM